MNPTGLAFAALIRAIRPAQSGATALVLPIIVSLPPTPTSYPLRVSASPQTA